MRLESYSVSLRLLSALTKRQALRALNQVINWNRNDQILGSMRLESYSVSLRLLSALTKRQALRAYPTPLRLSSPIF